MLSTVIVRAGRCRRSGLVPPKGWSRRGPAAAVAAARTGPPRRWPGAPTSCCGWCPSISRDQSDSSRASRKNRPCGPPCSISPSDLDMQNVVPLTMVMLPQSPRVVDGDPAFSGFDTVSTYRRRCGPGPERRNTERPADRHDAGSWPPRRSMSTVHLDGPRRQSPPAVCGPAGGGPAGGEPVAAALDRVGGAEHQVEPSDLDGVAAAQPGLIDPFAVDIGAVEAAQVDDGEAAADPRGTPRAGGRRSRRRGRCPNRRCGPR